MIVLLRDLIFHLLGITEFHAADGHITRWDARWRSMEKNKSWYYPDQWTIFHEYAIVRWRTGQ